jgi:hypothetical protein
MGKMPASNFTKWSKALIGREKVYKLQGPV